MGKTIMKLNERKFCLGHKVTFHNTKQKFKFVFLWDDFNLMEERFVDWTLEVTVEWYAYSVAATCYRPRY